MPSIINGFITFSLIVTLTYFVGVLVYLTDYEENKCEMTYMFQYPQFVRISTEMDEKYPKYGLYAYSEGRLTEKARDMEFDGIPVLFIPGNAGSHRQVRSLASVALVKAQESRTPFHFDYFTLDLNGELSGLNGALLYDQLDYANYSIYRILELYKYRKYPPKSVMLFGHSMGGVIARHLVAQLPPNSGLVPIVLTLAAPHARSPLSLDPFTDLFYEKIKNLQLTDTTIISISGGYNDFLVPSFLTELNNSLHVVTTHVPLGWVSTDHLSILWCKQIVLALNRALFESVDRKTRQISTDPEHRWAVFHHHLVHHSGTSSLMRNNYAEKTTIRNDGEWIESIYRQYTVTLNEGVKEPHFYMLRLLNHRQHEAVTVVALNLKTVDWAFACGAHIPRGSVRVCEKFEHLTQLSEISPSARYKRRSLRVNLHEILKSNADLTHVVLRVLPTSEPVILHIDVYNPEDRRIIANLPRLFYLRRIVIVDLTPKQAVNFELVLPQLQHIMQSYYLFLEPIKCSNEFRHSTATLEAPWDNQNYHKHFTDTDNKPMVVRLYSSKPQSGSNQSAIIRLTLDPTCRYQISVQTSPLGVLGQLARFYTPQLLANVAAVILMALSSQLNSLSEGGQCSLFFVAVKEGAKPYYILTGVKLLSRFVSLHPIARFLPASDWVTMVHEGTDFFLLPLLLYVCSVGIVWLLGVILAGSLVFFETTTNKVVTKFLSRFISFTGYFSDNVLSALQMFPLVAATTLVCLTVTTTGGVALCVGMVFYFMKLTQLSQDFIEELVWNFCKKVKALFTRSKPPTDTPSTNTDGGNNEDDADKKNEDEKDKNEIAEEKSLLTARNPLFFHATMFMLWSLITLLNLPSVLTWAHNFKYSTVLLPDPAFFPGFILSLCAMPLWQYELPIIERKWYEPVGNLVVILAVISLMYAPLSVFRLNHILTTAFVLIAGHQMLGSNKDDELDSDPSPSSPYQEIKTKLE